MHTVWSRAAQTRPCRCVSRFHSTTKAVARRTTTSTGRRRFKSCDVFTACYSAAFATAAVADAKVKDKRREHWDQIIEDAKAKLDAPQEDGMTPGTKNAMLSSPTDLSSYEALSRDILPTFPTKTNNLRNERHTSAAIQWIQRHLDREVTSFNVGNLRGTRERQLDEGARHQFLQERGPKTLLHLEKMQEMVVKLVNRLLLALNPTTAKTQQCFSQPSETSDQLSVLPQGLHDYPRFALLGSQSAKEERTALNQSIETICLEESTSVHRNMDLMVAKICYNLLTSAAPPDIHTYNLLIERLTELKQPRLAQAIVDGLKYEECRLMPNSTTVASMLKHYTASRNVAGFRSVVARMRAVEGDMAIRSRSLSSLHEPAEQVWAMNSRVIHRGGHLREKFTRDQQVFDALIKGSLQLHRDLRPAMMYTKAMIRDGFQLSSDVFSSLVSACMRANDTKMSHKLFIQLLTYWKQAQRPSSEFTLDATMRFWIRKLLHFCGIEESVSGLRTKQDGLFTWRVVLASLCRSMQFDAMTDAITRSAVLTRDIQDAFSDDSLQVSPTQLIERIEQLHRTYAVAELERQVKAVRHSIDALSSQFKNASVPTPQLKHNHHNQGLRDNVSNQAKAHIGTIPSIQDTSVRVLEREVTRASQHIMKLDWEVKAIAAHLAGMQSLLGEHESSSASNGGRISLETAPPPTRDQSVAETPSLLNPFELSRKVVLAQREFRNLCRQVKAMWLVTLTPADLGMYKKLKSNIHRHDYLAQLDILQVLQDEGSHLAGNAAQTVTEAARPDATDVPATALRATSTVLELEQGILFAGRQLTQLSRQVKAIAPTALSQPGLEKYRQLKKHIPRQAYLAHLDLIQNLLQEHGIAVPEPFQEAAASGEMRAVLPDPPAANSEQPDVLQMPQDRQPTLPRAGLPALRRTPERWTTTITTYSGPAQYGIEVASAASSA